MNDNTRIRIAVPAHLYESVKKQLTLKEAKQNFGAGYTAVKEKKNTGESKPKVEGMKSSKAPKMEAEKTEKTVEERVIQALDTKSDNFEQIVRDKEQLLKMLKESKAND